MHIRNEKIHVVKSLELLTSLQCQIQQMHIRNEKMHVVSDHAS